MARPTAGMPLPFPGCACVNPWHQLLHIWQPAVAACSDSVAAQGTSMQLNTALRDSAAKTVQRALNKGEGKARTAIKAAQRRAKLQSARQS